MSRHIVAMGGGGFSMELDNLALDAYVVSLSSQQRPKACFIPTASADSQPYCELFGRAFDALGCLTSSMSLFRPHTTDIKSFILDQDILYVGGGNTRNLLVLWKEWNLDQYLWEAYQNGTILAGLSAGANCWFESFSTDSMGPLQPWTGLGWLKGSFCPHYDGEEDRRPLLKEMMVDGHMKAGYAADDGAAIHFINESPEHYISSRQKALVYNVSAENGSFVENAIPMKVLDKLDKNV